VSHQEGRGELPVLPAFKEDTGAMLTRLLAPLDEAIRELDVPFRASHFAEDCRDWPQEGSGCYQAHASRFVFAIEAAGGRVTEYSLCAARGPDGRCGLYVSVCDYHRVTEQREREDGTVESVDRIVIDDIRTVRPESLSLAVRAQMLDELSQGHFLRAYRAYLQEHGRDNREGVVIRYWMPGQRR